MKTFMVVISCLASLAVFSCVAGQQADENLKNEFKIYTTAQLETLLNGLSNDNKAIPKITREIERRKLEEKEKKEIERIREQVKEAVQSTKKHDPFVQEDWSQFGSNEAKKEKPLVINRPRVIYVPGLSSTRCTYKNGVYKIVDYFGHVYETSAKCDFDNAVNDIKHTGRLSKNTRIYHVPTADEIAAAEEERRRQEALEEDRRRFEAQLAVERERVRAIEEQNALLNDIRWSIDNQPPPVNNYIIAPPPPPRRRWR